MRMCPSIDDSVKIYDLYSSLRSKGLTCLGPERFVGAAVKVLDVITNNVEGSIVECGTYKGGCLAIMAKFAYPERKVWGFDTFDGIPRPSEKDGSCASARGHKGDLAATVEDVYDSLDTVSSPKDHVTLVKGLFQDTIKEKKSEIGKIAVLRLDGDWYDSTKVCLDEFYDQVSDGGWIIIDDYGHWPGCKLAVDEFIASRGLNVELIVTDYTERCWIK